MKINLLHVKSVIKFTSIIAQYAKIIYRFIINTDTKNNMPRQLLRYIYFNLFKFLEDIYSREPLPYMQEEKYYSKKFI